MEKPARKVGAFWTSVAVVCAIVTGIAQSPASHQGRSPHQQARGDGITVHGHWTIDVRNPDGALASHHEFENALEPTGAAALSALLLRAGTLPSWQLDLIGASGGPCASLPVSGGPSLFIGASPLQFDPQTNTWSAGQPRPGALPVLDTNSSGVAQLAHTSANTYTFRLQAPNGGSSVASSTVNLPGGSFSFDAFNQGVDPVTGAQVTTAVVTASTTDASGTPTVSPGTYIVTFQLTTPSGSYYLISDYQIAIVVPAAPPTASTPSACTSVEANTPIPPQLAGAVFPTLTLNQIQFAVGGSGVELAGNVTATSADAIDQVRSLLVFANTTTRTPFSARTLPTPIQVVAGQQVFVKVLFTFS